MTRAVKRFVVTGLIAAAAACSGNGTEPGVTLSVRLRDDAGAPVNRNTVSLFVSAAETIRAQTGSDGTVSFRIPSSGTYEVLVVPRAGYHAGVDPLRKSVSVAASFPITLEFTLQRHGVSTVEPRTPSNP